MENKPASLVVVPLGKALNGIPPSQCGRKMAGNSSASSYSASSLSRDKRINMPIIIISSCQTLISKRLYAHLFYSVSASSSILE